MSPALQENCLFCINELNSTENLLSAYAASTKVLYFGRSKYAS